MLADKDSLCIGQCLASQGETSQEQTTFDAVETQEQDTNIPMENSPTGPSQNNRQRKQQVWGDKMNKVTNNSIRILFQNVKGMYIPSPATHEEFKSNAIKLGAHLIGICESNVNLRHASLHHQWENPLQRRYTELQFSHSSCNEGSSKLLQRGGTSTICRYRLSARLISKGHYNTLGRWSWMRFKVRKSERY